MEYFWKENKRFVLAVAGGLAFLILYQSLVLGRIRSAGDLAERTRRNRQLEIERKMAQGVPTEESLVAARKDRDLTRKTLADMVPATAFVVPDRFQKPKGARPKDVRENYEDQVIKLTEELKEKATNGRLSFPPTVGMPDNTTVADDAIPELLLRLAVVDRLATLCIDSGCEKIESINPMHGADQDDRASKKSRFLTKYSVFIRFSGTAESVFKVVHGAQKKGSYLAVTQFEMSRPDATKNVFEAAMGVALIKVDDKGALDAP
jgi:hypothetical protein